MQPLTLPPDDLTNYCPISSVLFAAKFLGKVVAAQVHLSKNSLFEKHHFSQDLHLFRDPTGKSMIVSWLLILDHFCFGVPGSLSSIHWTLLECLGTYPGLSGSTLY